MLMKKNKAALIIILLLTLVMFSYHPDEADAAPDWDVVIRSECNYVPPIQIEFDFMKRENSILYRASATAGECRVNIGIRQLANITSRDLPTIRSLVQTDILTWGNNRGKIIFEKPKGIDLRNKGSFTK